MPSDPGADPGRPDPGLPVELLGDEPVRWSRRDEPDEPEQLEVLTRGEPWHPPRWLAWVVALAVVAGGLGWYADHRVRVRETAAVVRCEHRLQDSSEMSDLRMGAMVSYIRPSLMQTHGAQQLHLADLMSGPARRVLPAVQRADVACRAVSVRPWHFSLVARRSAATAYADALATLLQAVAAQGRAYFHADPTLDRLRQAAGITPGPG